MKNSEIEKIYLPRSIWIQINCDLGSKIVDIGSNKGHIFDGYPERENVTFVDIDLYDLPNFVQADAHNLPFKDKEFDIAVLAEILEHVKDPVQVLKEAKRIAKKIVITTPDEYEWPPEMLPFKTKEEMAQLKGLSVEEMAKRDNPAIKFYEEDNLEHLFHQRYYTYEMFKEHLDKARFKEYKISKLYHQPGDIAFWVAICLCP